MDRIRSQAVGRLIGLALLALVLFSPRPAQAQSAEQRNTWDMPGLAAMGVGAAFYLVGGTATFLTLDLTRRSPNGGIPNGIGVAQVVYASTLVTAGALTFRSDSPGFGAALMGLGAGLAAIPIVDWTTRGLRRPQTAFRLTPTSVSVSGTF